MNVNSSKLQAPRLAGRRASSKLRRIILFAACSLQLVALLSGCAKREIRNLSSQGTNIVCFGDSITFGYGVSHGEDYPTALAAILPFPVINAGVDGDTTTEALQRIQSDVLDRDPFLVIIEFGGNDFLKGIPTDVTVNNIAEMTSKIQAQGAMVAIVDISAGLLLNQYRRQVYDICKSQGAIFIPRVLTGIITNPSLKSDFIHPNAEGYKIIAQRVLRTLEPYLNQRKQTP